jgi:outer membrane protein assembly factor BamB
MKRLTIILYCLCALVVPLSAQNVGDQATAGGSNNRNYLNSNAGAIAPPFERVRTLILPDGADASSLTVFEQSVLVGSAGNPGPFWLLNKQSGAVRWTAEIPGGAAHNYVPAMSGDVVLLGGSATTTVTAVQVSTGQQLWSEDRFGSSVGRSPILTNNLALFHGPVGITAADPTDGTVFWRFPATSEPDSVSLGAAPSSMFGSSVYLAGQPVGVTSLNLLNGSPAWTTLEAGENGSDILATQKYVFVTNPSSNSLTALAASTGALAWTLQLDGPLGTPGIALAYNQLFVFYSRDGKAVVGALRPESGDLIWEETDPSEDSGAPLYAAIADNSVFFYNSGSERVRVLDAFTGTLTWSHHVADVRALSVAGENLYTLLGDSLEIYQPIHQLYLSQIADGAGATTLITLANLSSVVNSGTVEFLNESGEPLALEVVGVADPVSSVNFSLQPNGTAKIQTTGNSLDVHSGWARVTGIRSLKATAVFQYSDDQLILFEAGVGDSPATGAANLFVTRISPSASSQISTGLALVNPSDETATVAIQFRRKLPTSATLDTELTLEPGQHIAEFVEELFPGGTDSATEGYLILRSDIPIALTTLRTQNGYQMSSYPVGIPGN